MGTVPGFFFNLVVPYAIFFFVFWQGILAWITKEYKLHNMIKIYNKLPS